MKIHHLLDDVSIAITNEEQAFIKGHHTEIPLSSLVGRETVVAQNLVRKNVYKLTTDSKHIVINKGHGSNRSII
jgi:hypothetical protein